MSRRPDPERKPELVAQILDYLLDKPLSSLTFRTLASGLGVSTFTLVYHFGTRAELLSEIVAAISGREAGIHENMVAHPASLDAYFDGLESSWQWAMQPRNRQLQRLEFEASMIEALDPSGHVFVRKLFARWQRLGYEALLSGLEQVPGCVVPSCRWVKVWSSSMYAWPRSSRKSSAKA